MLCLGVIGNHCKYMRHTFLAILILCVFTNLAAQPKSDPRFELSGIVISKINSQPLPNVVVMVRTINNYVVTTDSLGQFQISGLKPGTHRFEIREFGYQPIDTSLTLTDSGIGNAKFEIGAVCEFTKEAAIQDIRGKKIKLLLSGGIAPAIYKSDSKFERKFNVKYFDFGCTPEANECMIEYNSKVFEYLDSKFGDKWRKSVRQDVIGIN